MRLFSENLNPGFEPANKHTFDWALWRGQMALLDTLPDDPDFFRRRLEAVHWLGEVRRQHGGGEPGEPGGWPCPNGSLIGSLDVWFTVFGDWMKPKFPSNSRHDRELAMALWYAHQAILEVIGRGQGTEHDIAACRRIHHLTHVEAPPDLVEIESDHSMTTSMEVWIRG